ncbi:phytoene/squalene synthase family protein [Antarcticirhabdus aurantiaca]|uniref:Phytoene/squalene synthase family protein n=1 Tax=Antarcticirhabdus aurantiaca TaxID=2606717 RepID=A0ACD4NWR4_9HYPH|nr:phytoene/squalene synthase family protein [Antarcticirhabdus aurantiaca]WAJ31119.1 phytoene/squalene synthase family protein [Jeongeuplla avenae]
MDIPQAAVAECERIVREAGPDRAVSLGFAPREKQPGLLALYAFDIEAGRVRDHVSQPLAGEIRLQWWRDRIAAAAAVEAAGHPVADALLATIRAHALPVDALDRYVEARIFDLYDDPMPDRAAFEAYAGETQSAILMLAAMILDSEAAPGAAEAAGHGGVALAAVQAIRRLPIARRRGPIVLPGDLLAAAGCSAEALQGGDAQAGGRAVLAMADFAEEHWRAFEAVAKPPSLRPALLPVSLVPSLLRKVRADPAACLERSVEIGALARLARYWRAMRG